MRSLFALVLGLGFAAEGCVPASDSTGSRPSTVIVAASGSRYILPDESDADLLVFLPLATRGPDGQLVPRLARSWEPSADWNEVRYHLRTDVLWHDGIPVTAHDVKYTLDLLGHPDLSEYTFDSVAVLDDSTVLVRNRQHSYIDDIVYYPRHLIKDLEPGQFYDWEFWFRPVGNGPYRFVRYEPATLMELEANPDFYDGKPAIEKIIVRFLGSTDAALNELLAGNADVAESRDLATRDMVAMDPRFERYVRYVGATAVMFLNHNRPLLSDARVRTALILALDRRALSAAIGLPPDLPIVDGLFTVEQLVQGDLPRAFEYDPEQARLLLAEAGWIDRDGDGRREREGVTARFEILSPGWWEKSAVLVAAELAEVGIEVELFVADNSVNLVRYRTGDFDAAIGFVTPWGLSLLHSRDSPTGYDNEAYKELVRRARETPSPHVRDSLILEARHHLFEDVPAIFLHPMATQFYVHRRIRGLSSPWRADPGRYMDELWIEEEPPE
jgi:peptide/nickel transport system substrate-binding protein